MTPSFVFMRKALKVTLANSEEPDEMSQNVALPFGYAQCLLRLK